MNPDLLFSLVNALSFLGWILLLLLPYNKRLKSILISILIAGFSLMYAILVLQSLQLGDLESFNSLEGLSTLFGNKTALLVGWIHYLAFDLMVGLYISKNAEKYGLNRILLSVCLIFTFMLGPIGLLLYLLFRAIKNKRYFHSY